MLTSRHPLTISRTPTVGLFSLLCLCQLRHRNIKVQ